VADSLYHTELEKSSDSGMISNTALYIALISGNRIDPVTWKIEHGRLTIVATSLPLDKLYRWRCCISYDGKLVLRALKTADGRYDLKWYNDGDWVEELENLRLHVLDKLVRRAPKGGENSERKTTS